MHACNYRVRASPSSPTRTDAVCFHYKFAVQPCVLDQFFIQSPLDRSPLQPLQQWLWRAATACASTSLKTTTPSATGSCRRRSWWRSALLLLPITPPPPRSPRRRRRGARRAPRRHPRPHVAAVRRRRQTGRETCRGCDDDDE